MSKRKYIYWRKDMQPNGKGEQFANVHILTDSNRGSLNDFREMAEELKKDFPEASDDQIYCGKVTHSRSVYGFSIVSYNAHIPAGDYPGWTQVEHGNRDYNW